MNTHDKNSKTINKKTIDKNSLMTNNMKNKTQFNLRESEEICIIDDSPIPRFITKTICERVLPSIPLKVFEDIGTGSQVWPGLSGRGSDVAQSRQAAGCREIYQ